MEQKSLHATVREGYQILLRADVEYLLPVKCERIRAFYERMTDTCLKWALEVHGEQLRREFLSLESVREKSQFGTRRYRLVIHVPWEEEIYTAILCESRLTGQWKEPQQSYHRISHVWNTDEQSILPFSEILERFGMSIKRSMLPFVPHGIYPQGDEMVFFRNAGENAVFEERRLPRAVNSTQNRV